MSTTYLETPKNWRELEAYVNKGELIKDIFTKKKCFFYDTCSFRYHANLDFSYAEKILEYIKDKDGIIILTRCILMELGFLSGELNKEYIQYIGNVFEFGVNIYVIYEEDLFDIVGVCFNTNASANNLLTWAVRMINGPVSTIAKALEEDSGLSNEIIQGKNQNSNEIYKRFFKAVRANKESQDNLSEELLAICVHILTQLPGEEDGKFCILTDDKGAAGKIDMLFQKTHRQYKGKKIIMFSTPKMVQTLFLEGYINGKDELITILHAKSKENIKVLGTQIYDLKSNEICLSVEELSNQIIKNQINITF